MKTFATILASTLAVCSSIGCGSSSSPSQVVTAEVVSASKMPFHGPGGPGSDPISITFSWTVVVRSDRGPDCRIERVISELSEPQSRQVLSATTLRQDRLPGGGRAEVPQQQAGFLDSSLFARPWTGRTHVDVACPGGAMAAADATFTVP